jgi:type II secretory ATPase GspE/PulE/Tfp pilus assembly ATPase PilB-like protein
MWDKIKVFLESHNVGLDGLSPNLLNNNETLVPHLAQYIKESDLIKALTDAGLEIFSDKTHTIVYKNSNFVIATNQQLDHVLFSENPFSEKIAFTAKQHAKKNNIELNVFGFINHQKALLLFNKTHAENSKTLLNKIIEIAASDGVSDIHISARNSTNIAILFRKFGEIVESGIDDILLGDYEKFANNLISNAGGNSGAFSIYLEKQIEYKELAIRVQQNPSIYKFSNEKLGLVPNFVLRLHDKNKSADVRTIGEVGFEQKQQQVLQSVASHNSGLIIVAGPTGSGKTTALYSILNEILENRKRIVQTIEDPVEIIIPGINQTNVNKETGITYENAINKSILRSDTDVALIGEIRSPETAKGVVELDRVGHLVLATVHTKTTGAIIDRMNDFGVSYAHLAEALSVMISTRLVKKVCSKCSTTSLSIHELKKFENIDFDELGDDEKQQAKENKEILKKLKVFGNSKYIGEKNISTTDRLAIVNENGCECCDSGYNGRAMVAEVVVVDNSIKELIRNGASPKDIMQHFEKHGNLTIWQHGLQLVKQGITTIEALELVLPNYSNYGNNYSADESKRI